MEKVAVRKKSTTYVLILNFRVSYLALSLFYYFADSLIITITKDIKVKISRPVRTSNLPSIALTSFFISIILCLLNE